MSGVNNTKNGCSDWRLACRLLVRYASRSDLTNEAMKIYDDSPLIFVFLIINGRIHNPFSLHHHNGENCPKSVQSGVFRTNAGRSTNCACTRNEINSMFKHTQNGSMFLMENFSSTEQTRSNTEQERIPAMHKDTNSHLVEIDNVSSRLPLLLVPFGYSGMAFCDHWTYACWLCVQITLQLSCSQSMRIPLNIRNKQIPT